MTALVILIEATPLRASDGAAQTVRLAGGGALCPYFYGGQHWRAGVVGLPTFITSIEFSGGDFGNGGVPQAAELQWAPSTKADLSAYSGYFWIDAPITVRIGPENANGTLPDVRLTGKVLSALVDGGTLKIALSDPAADLKKPLLAARFGGTGGLDGPSDWNGRIKERVWGRVWNKAGAPIDKANNIYSFADPARPIQAFDALRDKGAAAASLTMLAWQGTMAATFAALQAASVPRGGGVVCPSLACVKWWTQPAGELTADLRGEIGGGYVETTAGIVQRIVAAGPNTAFASGTITAAISARPAPVGWVAKDDNTTIAAMIEELLGNSSMLWVLNALGQIEIREWAWGSSVISARSQSVKRTATFRPVATRKIGYQRNERKMARGDLAAIVLAEDATYADGTPIENLKPAQPGADVTGGNTAAAITGQGPLATAPGGVSLDNGTYFTVPTRLQPSPGGLNSLPAGAILYGGPAYASVDSLRPAEPGSNVTESRTAAAITGQGPWATTSTPVETVLNPSSNFIYNSSFKIGLGGWATTGSWTTEANLASYYSGSAGTTGTLTSQFFFLQGGQYTLSLTESRYNISGRTITLLAYDAGYIPGRVPSADIVFTPALGVGSRTSMTFSTSSSYTYKLQVSATSASAAHYYQISKIKLEKGATATLWTDELTNGAAYIDLDARGFPTYQPIDVLKPAEFGSNVTETHTASAIAGQGAFATQNSVAYGSSYLTGFGAAATQARFNLGGAYLYRADGSTALTDGSVVTALGTASAIAGQGAFATQNSVAYGSSYLTGFGAAATQARFNLGGAYLYRADGSTALTDGSVVTALGTASAIAGQGPWATTSLSVAAVTNPSPNLLYNPSFRLGFAGWSPSSAEWATSTGYGYYVATMSAASAGTKTLTSDYFSVATGSAHTLCVEDFAFGATRTITLLAYDNGYYPARVPANDIVFTPAISNFARASMTFTPTGSSRYRLQVSATASVAGYYYQFRKLQLNQSATPVMWTDEGTVGAMYYSTDAATGAAIFQSAESLKPAEIGSNVTETRIASAIMGQAPTATNSDYGAITGATKPANNATRNDDGANMIQSPVLLDRCVFFSGAYLEVTSNATGRPADYRRVVLQSNSANARWCGATDIPCRPGETLWYSDVIRSDGGTTETCNVSVAFYKPNGSVLTAVNLSSQTQVTLADVSGGWVRRNASFPVPAGAAFVQPYVERPTFASYTFFVGEPFLGRSQPGADVTANSQHTIVAGSTAIDFIADYQNTLLAGQLDRTIPMQRKLGTTDVTSSTTWTKTQSAGITCAISSAGVLSFTAVASGVVTVTGIYNGIPMSVAIAVTRSQQSAPATSGGGAGGGGGGTASTAALSAATSNSYVTGTSGALALAASSSGQIDLTAGVDFWIGGGTTSFAQTQDAYGKWQWRVVGGTFADVAAEAASSYPAYQPASSGGGGLTLQIVDAENQASPGRIDVIASKAGLTSGTTYEFRWVWRKASAGGGSLTGAGSFYAAQH